MTILRTYPAGWAIGEKLTSAQQNAIDIELTHCLDKRAAQVDTLASVVSLSGAGRIIGKYAVGSDSSLIYYVTGANSMLDVTTLTAERVYIMSNTGAQAGDSIVVLNRSNFLLNIQDHSGNPIVSLGPSITDNAESLYCTIWHTGAGWILAESNRRPAVAQLAFTASGSLMIPRGVVAILPFACGGGGGGGGGASQTGSDVHHAGGGGGGGASLVSYPVPVTPQETLAINIGAGGSGGSFDASGVGGGDTTITRGGVVIFKAGGAMRGLRGRATSIPGPEAFYWGLGGLSVNSQGGVIPVPNTVQQDLGVLRQFRDAGGADAFPDFHRNDAPGSGGAGVTGNGRSFGYPGNGSITGWDSGNGRWKGDACEILAPRARRRRPTPAAAVVAVELAAVARRRGLVVPAALAGLATWFTCRSAERD